MSTERAIFYADQQLNLSEMTIKLINTRGSNNWVVRGWLRENFNLSIQNNWSTGDSTIMKSIVDTAAGFITSRDSKMFLNIADKGLSWAKGKVDAGGKAEEVIGKLSNLVHEGKKYANSHIFSADDFYKSFKGTDVTVPTGINITLVTDSVTRDIYTDLGRLFDASMGEFSSPIWGFVGVQMPPNDFNSSANSLGDFKTIEGTLNLEIGNPEKGGYRIDNLVINSVNISASTVKVRLQGGAYRPLYMDVMVGLEPASKFTPRDVKRMFNLPEDKK